MSVPAIADFVQFQADFLRWQEEFLWYRTVQDLECAVWMTGVFSRRCFFGRGERLKVETMRFVGGRKDAVGEEEGAQTSSEYS